MLEEIAIYARTPTTIDYLFSAGLGGYMVYQFARDRLGSWLGDRGADDRDDDDLEDLRQDYIDGEISIGEFEDRVGLALDEDARQVRSALEEIDGIGPETSAPIAQEFGTVAALEAADRSTLLAIDGIGPVTADAILETF